MMFDFNIWKVWITKREPKAWVIIFRDKQRWLQYKSPEATKLVDDFGQSITLDPWGPGGAWNMRGPSDTKDVLLENTELIAQNRELKAQLADVLDENQELHDQIERYLNQIAELESNLADLKATKEFKNG